MSKTYRTTGSGASQTLHEIEDEKIPVYDTQSDAEADLANLEEGQIVATKDAGTDEQTLMEYVDGRLETTTTEIAMDTFKTGSKAQLYKSGNNVQFNYFVSDSTTFNPITEATWVSIGTIPEGFRPKSDIQFLFQGSPANAQGGVAGMVKIKYDGRVLIYKNTGMNFGYEFSIQCDYNVDGTNSHGMTVNTLKDAKDYTDEKAVRKYNYTMTGTTNPIADIQALCNQLVSLGDNTYAGEFFRSGQTSGHYSISVIHSTNLFVNGTITLGQDVNTDSTWSVHRLNDTYHIRMNVINKNIDVPGPSTTLSSVKEYLLYQLQNADWTFLTFHPIGATAAGQFLLSGNYWGNYVATHHGSNYITVTGTIDFGGQPYTFSAFYDSNVTAWKVNVTGSTVDVSNTLVTLDANSCFKMGDIGVPDGFTEVLSVHAWTTDGQGQVNSDYLCIPSQNVYNQWYCRVEGWGGGLIPGQVVWVWARYRLVG